MKKLTYFATKMNNKHGRIAVLILTIALFVISAAAPNATIGIGK